METASLSGRRVVDDDVEFVRDVWNDERVAPAVGGVRNERELRERMGRWTDHWNAYGYGEELFHERSTGRPIGWGGLQQSFIGIGQRLTVGYVISPDVWGCGYATEIANASVAHAVAVLGAEQLFASVAATNAASRRVLEKAGLSFHSEIDHGEQVELIYAITRLEAVSRR